MSKHDHESPKINKQAAKRLGSCIDHGLLHSKEHFDYSRRDFLRNTGLFGIGGMVLGNSAIQMLTASSQFKNLLSADCGDRILVLIRLDGGNDGLNTIVPFTNDEYYNIRPNIAMQPNQIWQLSQDFGMPNLMTDLQSLWGDGHMKVIHNVGYPEPNYSHFRSADIWASSSDEDKVVNTGWIGRLLDNQYESFLTTPPVVPPALEIGVQTNLLFRGNSGAMALAVSNPTEFYQIASTGQLYDTKPANNSEHEKELSYLRTVTNSAYRYSESIKAAYTKGKNTVSYPQDSYLSEQLAIISRLIKGQLGTKIYMVSIGGFDNHANQLDDHPGLQKELAESVRAFFSDIGQAGMGPNVMAMTFSEFGRTIFENGSMGTDHGTGAPMMFFGEGLEGNGFLGTASNLVDVGPYGDPEFTTDFRSVYATVLQDWLCVTPEEASFVVGKDIPKLNGIMPVTDPLRGLNTEDALLGHNPGPAGTILMKYSISKRGPMKLELLNNSGLTIRTFENTVKEKGSYIFSFSPMKYFVGPGEYIYKLESGGRSYTRKIKI